MTNLDHLENIVARPFMTYPLSHKDLPDLKVSTDSSNFKQSVKSIKRCSVTGNFILEFNDGNHEEFKIDETLATEIINQMKSIAGKKGKYKPTMDSKQKELYLNHYHWRYYQDKKSEIEGQMDDEYPIFCICGKLATGLHTMSCRRWRNHLTMHTVQTMKDMLPKLEPIKLPA